MQNVVPMRRQRPSRIDHFDQLMELLTEAEARGLWTGDAAVHARAVFDELRARITQGKGFRFVQMNMERMAEIMEAMEGVTDAKGVRIARPMEALRVLHAVLNAAGWEDQWCTKTQAEIATDLKMKPASVSRAFRVLSHPIVRAVVKKRKAGSSVQWEIDAQLGSRLESNARLAAAARQERERQNPGQRELPLRDLGAME